MTTVSAVTPIPQPLAPQIPKKNVAPMRAATKLKLPKIAKPKVPDAKMAKVPSSHPTYNLMIKKAIADLNEKKGSSRPAILKFLMSHYKLGENMLKINANLKLGLKRGVKSGELKQVKGVGASGSFRLGDTPKPADAKKSPKKKAVTKKPTVKKATPKKIKKAVPKKSPAVKKAKTTAVAPATAPVAASPAAAKVKAVKVPKKSGAKKPKTPKKSPKMIAKKPTTPKKATGRANKLKSPKVKKSAPKKVKKTAAPAGTTVA